MTTMFKASQPPQYLPPRHLIYIHRKRQGHWPKALLIWISWLPKGHTNWIESCSMDAEGHVYEERIIHHRGANGGGLVNPVPEKYQEAVRKTVRELPLPNRVRIPVERWLLVSFHRDRAWQTYIYDRKDAPISLRSVYEAVNHSRSPLVIPWEMPIESP